MRVAYFTDGLASSVNASLELSRRLSEAGHEVVYLSPADIGDTINEAGYTFRHLQADRRFIDASPPVGWRTVTKPSRWANAIKHRREVRRQSIENDEITGAVAELDPDVLLIDFEMHFAIFATAQLHIPTLLTTVFFSMYRRPGLVPLNSSISPASASRYAVEAEWLRHWTMTRFLQWRQRAIRAVHADWYRPARYDSMDVDTLKAVARHNNVDPKILGRSDWQRPFTHPTLPLLSFNLFELELPHEPSPLVHYVGPMVRPVGSGRAGTEEWTQFRQARPPGRPLVYCSLGTYWGTDFDFLHRVAAAVEQHPEWDLVIGLGDKGDPADMGQLPPNVLVLRVAPQTDVLSEASVCITHGGATTIAECVALAVPVVVYSTGHVDQNGNATRVSYHQIGQLGSSSDTADRIGERLSSLLSDAEVHGRLAQLGKRVAEVNNQAVDIITTTVAAGAKRG